MTFLHYRNSASLFSICWLDGKSCSRTSSVVCAESVRSVNCNASAVSNPACKRNRLFPSGTVNRASASNAASPFARSRISDSITSSAIVRKSPRHLFYQSRRINRPALRSIQDRIVVQASQQQPAQIVGIAGTHAHSTRILVNQIAPVLRGFVQYEHPTQTDDAGRNQDRPASTI